MKMTRIVVTLMLAVMLAGVASLAKQTEPAGSKMATAAEKLLDSLSPEQKTKATFGFDDKHRVGWFFTPQQMGKKYSRKGLPLEEMNEDQRKATLDLLASGTSKEGNKKATTIMSLEAILRELEKNGAMVRNPEWYFVSIFGKPSKTGKWGWRIEGHHLSLNYTLDGGKVISATPAFFGANPATVQDGPRKGLRTLAESEDLAKDLFKSLDDEQKKAAFQETQFPEIAENTPAPKVGEAKGLAVGKMTDKQKGTLQKLLRSYADRMPADIAEVEMNRVKEAGMDKVNFAYAGGTDAGQPYTYRVQGPTFVVEFVNTQPDSAKNPANHIHSSWRSLKGDFGVEAE